jgi:hypothetical protein
MRFSAVGSRRAASAIVGIVVLGAAGVAVAKTPFPPRSAGAGSERNAGGGSGAGVAFRPRYSVATYEPVGGNYVIYLTDKPLPCARTYLATPPYLTVSIVTGGSPLVVGRPSLQRPDANFVQADFYVSSTHYYAVQPGVKLVLTHIDARQAGLWHGRLTVPTTHFQGKTFSFSGTFAARWCGRTP